MNKLSQELMNCRPPVQQFAIRMENKLQLNDHKDGWRNEKISYLMEQLQQKVNKLKLEFTYMHTQQMVPETINIANFAMMIADNIENS